MTKKAAIVGIGRMGCRHIEAAALADVEIVAACDVSRSAVDEVVKQSEGRITGYLNFTEMLQAKDAYEILIVATTGPSHHGLVIAAAEQGIPYILCEKPIATSGEKSREMAESCRKSGSKLAVNLCRRWMPTSMEMKKALQDGIIGDIRQINITAGAGGLSCVGTHYFDMAAWLMDASPKWVIGVVDDTPPPNVRGEQYFDPGGRAMVGFDNGVTAVFECSGDVARVSRGEIIGTKGIATFDDLTDKGMCVTFCARSKEDWDGPPNWDYPLHQVDLNMQPGPFEVIHSSAGCLQDLLNDHAENTVDGGIMALDIVLGIHISSQKGWQKVELPLDNDNQKIDIPLT